MKKVLISVLIVLLLILTYVVLDKGINIGFIKINSIKEIKQGSAKLDEDLSKANELLNKTYPSEVEGLEEAIRQLKISKQEYENKKLYTTEDMELGTVEIKTYTIHYLWTVIGNYKQDRGIKSLNLDLKSTQTPDVYDLQFTVVGKYPDIIEFLYDIEDDEKLNFEIKDFAMQPYEKTKTTVVTGEEGNGTETENPYKTTTEITITDKRTNITKNSNTTTSNTQDQTNKTEDSNILTSTAQNQTNNNSNSGTSKEVIYDPKWVQATFKIENIGITLE